MTTNGREHQLEPALSVDAPEWRWNPQRQAYEWWDGARCTARARWNGSSWSYLYFHAPPILAPPPARTNRFALWGIVLASLNVLVLGMLSYVLVPISLCLGVAGVVRAGRVGVMMELSVVTIILSLVGFAGGVFWYVHPPHFP